MTRVALLVATSTDDGGAVIARRLRHLLEAGWDAHLFCKGGLWAREPALADAALQKRVRVAARAAGDATPFARRLRRLRPGLMHFHSGWMASRFIERDRLPDVPVVIGFREDCRDLDVPGLDRIWSRGSLFLFRNELARERALAVGCPEDRAEVLEAPLPDFRCNGFRPGAPLRILSLGSMVWEQGFEHSIHAVRLLLDMGIPCEYRIVGEGEHIQAVAFARHQLGLHDEVQLVRPGAEDLGVVDVLVDPAVSDSLSSSPVVEAQSRAIPYVATERGRPLPEGGLVVPRRDPGALAEALAELARDPELRRRLGEAGRREAGPPTGIDHERRLEGLYRRALA